MVSITSTRIKKALLHPSAAFLYFKNYLRGEVIRQKMKCSFLNKVNLKKGLSKEVYQNLELHFFQRKRPLFFTDNSNFLEEITKQDFIIPVAEKILKQEFSFLGMLPKTVKNIDWDEDIKSGYRWPDNFYIDLREGLEKEYNKGRDIQIVWELSRFHYLIPLALAYHKTGEEKYLQKWQELILDWIGKNPLYYGPNWVNAMEVSKRACNWIFSWQIINKKGKLPRGFLEKFLISLIEHGRFIYSNLEYAPLPSNHYLSDITGLFFLGTMLPELREARKWLSYGKKALEKEIQRQVYKDGVDYELSISYHRYVTELFLWAGWLGKINQQDFSSSYKEKLKKMVLFTYSYIKPNGLASQIGDDDDSRLFLLWDDFYNWEKRDHSDVLRIYKYLEGRELEKSNAFPESGYYIIRDKDFYLITGRNKGCYGRGGNHTHNDILSFELNMNKEDFFVDSGTYVYTSDFKERNRFRSTRAHNTVMVDQQEQDRLSPHPFYSEQKAQLSVKQWKETEEEIVWEGEHNGYARLSQPVIHRRSFRFQREKKTLFLIDSFQGKGKHSLEWNFHLAPHIKVWIKEKTEGDREILLIGENCSLLFLAPQILNCVIIEDEVSSSYGVKIPTKTIRFSGFLEGEVPKEYEFRLQSVK